MWRLFNSRSLLVTALSLSASLSSPNIVRSMSSSLSTDTMRSPPAAKKVEHRMEIFGDVRVDNYYWLRDDSRTSPEVLSYLQQENAYTDSVLSGTKQFEDQLFKEIRGRIKEEDISVPYRQGPYYYYTRNLEGKEYLQHCRRLIPNHDMTPCSVHDTMPTGPDDPPEHVILDENIKAQEHGFYSIQAFKVSPNHKLVAYAEDTKGDEIYTVHVIDVEIGAPVGKPLTSVTSDVEWANDDTLVYITMDEILRPDKVWLHKLGTDQSSDICLYHEKDDTFSIDLQKSESHEFLFVGSENKITRFIFFIDASKPEDGLKVLTPHVAGIASWAKHRGNHFFIIRRSEEFFNSELLACPVDDVSVTMPLIPHRDRIKIQDVCLFANHLAVYERENGLPKVIAYHLPGVDEPLTRLEDGRAIDFIDPVYTVDPAQSEFNSSILRFSYSSLRTPDSVYDYDMNTGTFVVKKIETVLGGFDASEKNLVNIDGSDPLLLYGYGSYEVCIDPWFKASRLSLLDRGFIFAIAHIRGGGEMGRQWYENGKYLKKMNTFTDFIACAEYLIEQRLLFAGVPFVDALTTMLDPTIPLTTSEWEEWGDPRKEEFYHYMKAYSPVDNIKAQNYPHILVTAGLHDPRVMYSEPAKFVAKLRENKTDNNMLLLKCEFGAGHSSKSGKVMFSALS
ncbi:hypothetical protein OIU84_030293 [Salix udensis]|uniref:Prolyl endopeptidase n=1 Tax=Salix udensis TaxID=889485 RepID=A0AAD6KBJ5_9ROSI|nr:hypothetical protein OIU84_030293 [Salix udensis]